MEQPETEHMHKELPPIACTLTADEQAAWSEGIGRTIFEGYEEMRELPDGYALRYPGDDHWAHTLLAFVVHERECCPFFTFGMVVRAGPRRDLAPTLRQHRDQGVRR